MVRGQFNGCHLIGLKLLGMTKPGELLAVPGCRLSPFISEGFSKKYYHVREYKKNE